MQVLKYDRLEHSSNTGDSPPNAKFYELTIISIETFYANDCISRKKQLFHKKQLNHPYII